MIDYVFDIDGTLWNPTTVCTRAYTAAAEEWMREHDWTPEEDFRITEDLMRRQFGKPIAEVRDNLFWPFPIEARNDMIRKVDRIQIEMLKADPPPAFDGTEETLRYLCNQGCKLFIVSNCEAGYIPTMLECTGLGPYFTDMIAYADTGLLKADNLKLIIERNNLRDPVYVGDTLGDEIATHEAGIPFYYAAYGFGECENPERVINDIRELCD